MTVVSVMLMPSCCFAWAMAETLCLAHNRAYNPPDTTCVTESLTLWRAILLLQHRFDSFVEGNEHKSWTVSLSREQESAEEVAPEQSLVPSLTTGLTWSWHIRCIRPKKKPTCDEDSCTVESVVMLWNHNSWDTIMMSQLSRCNRFICIYVPVS